MCGHGTIGTVTAALENGLLTPKVPGKLVLDVPAGQINIDYQLQGEKVSAVRLYNVASYLAHQDVELDIPGFRNIDC